MNLLIKPHITALVSNVSKLKTSCKNILPLLQKDTFERFKPIEYKKSHNLREVHTFAALNFPNTTLHITNASDGNEIIYTMCQLYNMTKGKVLFPPIIETYHKKNDKFSGGYEDGVISINASYCGLASTLKHELGHYNHEQCCENYLKMGKESELIEDGITDYSFYEEFRHNKPALKLIRRLLGGYATSSACEFIACTFESITNGKKLPLEIWELYNKYDGPLATQLKPLFTQPNIFEL